MNFEKERYIYIYTSYDFLVHFSEDSAPIIPIFCDWIASINS